MKRVLLPLALLAVVSVILVLFWWTGAPSREHAGEQRNASAAAETASSSRVDAPARDLDTAEAHALGAQDDASARETAAADGVKRHVRGVVVAPLGCDDTAREVIVLREAMPWSRIVVVLDDNRGKDRELDDLEDNEVVAAFGGFDREDVETPVSSKNVLARSAIAADGRFDVALAAGAVKPDANGKRKVWLAVAGTFQYQANAVEVEVGDDGASVELQALCGGAVRVNVRAPEGVDVESALAGEVARLGPTNANFNGDMLRGLAVQRRALLADGVFEFHALPVETDYRLRMSPESVAAVELDVPKLTPGRTTETTLRLRSGGRLRGKVVGPDGTPLADATVRATTSGQWFGFDDTTVRRTRTASDGTFELVAVVPGKVSLHADHKRFLASKGKPFTVQDMATVEGVVLELATGATIAGTVKWPDGTPAADIDVRVTFDMGQMGGMGAMNALQGGSGRARSDAQGAFEVGGLGKGPFTVTASSPPRQQDVAESTEPPPRADGGANTSVSSPAARARAKRDEWQARRDTVAPNTRDLALVLAAPSGVRGRVQDESGNPVTKFAVFAQRAGSGVMGSLGQANVDETFEDAGGAFLLRGLIAGSWTVQVTADGFAQREPAKLELPNDGSELVLVVAQAARVTGVVKDPSGRPLAGAEIEQLREGPNWQRAMSAGPDLPEARSEEGGTFELKNLVPGRVKIVAHAKGFAPSATKELDLTATPVQSDVELVLTVGATLTGEVYDDSGKPAQRWMVQVQDTTTFSQELAFTEGDGRFRVEHLPPGHRQVIAMPSSAPRAQAADGDGALATDDEPDVAEQMTSFVSKLKMTTVQLVDGEEVHVVLGAPPRAPVEVSGNVTHAGAPYSGAVMTFMRRGKGRASSGFKMTNVAADGRYSVTLPEPGAYSVSIQKFGLTANQQGLVEFTRDVPEEKSARMDFEMPTGRISGRVRGPDGRPAASARVSLHAEGGGDPGTFWGGSYNESLTDSEGRFDIQALKPGKYSVLAGGAAIGGFGADLGDGEYGRETKSGLDLDAGQWLQNVDFALKKPGAIDVTVVDDAGKPVEHAGIFVRARGGEALDQFSMASTNADGTCRYGGLAEGRYTVSARVEGRSSSESGEIAVRPGERAAVKLVVTRGTYLVVEILDGEGKTIEASLSVRDDAGREVGTLFTLADIMKRFTGSGGDDNRVGPLAPGKYVVTATTADGKTTKKSVSLSGQEERKLTVRF